MSEINLKQLTIKKARESMEKGEYSAEEITRSYLENIKAKNPELNAYLAVFDDAIDAAREVDEKRKKGEKLGALAGIPIAIKDVIMVKGREVTGASKILKGHRATYDATVISKLREAGAIMLGMTNCDEFAMGASGENSAYGPTKNPLNTSKVPGGSSSGSAAAVAGDLALTALGSETGGSVRQPAAFTGLVGLKPTYGAVSRYGLLALCSSFDQIAPFGKTVADAEAVFNVIAGQDPLDSTSISKLKTPISSNLAKPKLKTVIGVPSDLPLEGCDPHVIANFKLQIEKLRELGYEIRDITLPNLKYAIPVYYIILPAEASANLARYDGVRYGAHKDGANLLEDYMKTKGEGYGKEVRRRIILGTYVLSAGYYDAYYYQAMRVRELMKQDFARAFGEVDAIVTPTTAGPAFELGTKSKRSPIEMYLEDIFTAPANIVGMPAIAVPENLQIIAPHQREDVLFEIGKKFLNE
ncbi:MAG TPA: Asp-tRNA(Asn)/Glu-tRNA(Gln) amidotransferase subunit GatA [Candidatus Paceibacterota bacterium]